ncbi:baseplate J/gp47 family protein [Acetobacterium tundrae]|uniref:Baseplate protein n=1 Tax=Acetobacterium tundrae TaxID=132932 RepID=A0ABR6WNK3_9FIRM|nr:baseplate J/gp47 family protein [Acetobacterium tundrae]MBC3798016.1 baseplate protein [Acetobacterium tundrae]
MAEIIDFEAPDFLKNQTENEIHTEMLADMAEQNPNRDMTEGSVFWDLTRPTAKEKARMVGFTLTEAIKNMFPMWSYGANLDWKATIRGMNRKAALFATGTVTVTGKAGTVIPSGFIFNTESTYGKSSVLFKTTETAVIPGTGTGQTVDIHIEAYSAGAIGNVAAGTITMLNTSLKGIASVINASKTKGGSDRESDDSLIQRILDFDQQQGISFVGSDADYKRWALEVTGVGGAEVIPATAGSETVTLVLTDSNGQPGSSDLCTQVYNHIMSPNDRSSRLAGTNDILSVIAAKSLTITINVTVITEDSRGINDIKNDLYTALLSYYKTAAAQNVARINEIGGILIDIKGVADYSGLTLNGSAANVTISTDEIPVTALTDITVVT